MSFEKASFLLAWDGGRSVFVYNPLDGSDPWNPAWTTDIGTPTGARYRRRRLAPRLHRRNRARQPQPFRLTDVRPGTHIHQS